VICTNPNPPERESLPLSGPFRRRLRALALLLAAPLLAYAADPKRELQVKQLLLNGTESYHDKDYDRALEWFDTLLGIDPRHKEALRYRTLTRQALAEALYDDGRKAWKAGELELADRYFLQALSLDPDHTRALGASLEIRGSILAGRKREAEKLYRKGLDAFSEGRTDAVAEHWKKALELDPDNREAARGLERLNSAR
jgi:tetratricopeptide (TPR) repeat protein